MASRLINLCFTDLQQLLLNRSDVGATDVTDSTSTGLPNPILVTRVDERRFGLPATAVERVFAVVEITPLSDAPGVIAGVVNIHGAVLPVLDLRRRLGRPSRPSRPTDKLVVVNAPARRIVLLVDAVEGVEEVPEAALVALDDLVPGIGMVGRIIAGHEGLIVVHDPERLLSGAEEGDLERALEELVE
ncbi:chemotaxis protein CheW [Azospirillum sp.]|uniref:chemotaxis protein CheW n=1 Tax=Azospirillum sp. TaxID=34012 RepID=UPI003D74239B